MTRARNFLPLAGFLLCAIAWLSYPLFFVRFPVTRDVPWANWLLFALGLALVCGGLFRAYRRSDRYRGKVTSPILAILSLAALGVFLFMTEVASRWLPASVGAPKIGDKAPDFTLPDADGRTVRLSDLLAPQAGGAPAAEPWVLLIFYRGHW